MHDEITQDPSKMTELMEKMTKSFADADANSDGVLDRQEFNTFIMEQNARNKAAGQFTDDRQEQHDKLYAATNMITSGVEGISWADVQMCMGISMAKNTELKNAAGL